jgi:hypothetical protein
MPNKKLLEWIKTFEEFRLLKGHDKVQEHFRLNGCEDLGPYSIAKIQR